MLQFFQNPGEGEKMRPCAVTLESELSSVELKCLLTVLQERGLKGKHLEVGTAAGGTLWKMMRCYPEEQRPDFVVVDPLAYFPDQLGVVQRNLRDNEIDPSQVEFRRTTSDKAVDSSLCKQERFDFVFVDGSHKICRVTEDLRWSECLNEGGIIAFHDVCPRLRGVQISVERFLRKHPELKVIARKETLLLAQKIAPMKCGAVSRWDRLFALLLSPVLSLETSLRKRLRRFGLAV